MIPKSVQTIKMTPPSIEIPWVCSFLDFPHVCHCIHHIVVHRGIAEWQQSPPRTRVCRGQPITYSTKQKLSFHQDCQRQTSFWHWSMHGRGLIPPSLVPRRTVFMIDDVAGSVEFDLMTALSINMVVMDLLDPNPLFEYIPSAQFVMLNLFVTRSANTSLLIGHILWMAWTIGTISDSRSPWNSCHVIPAPWTVDCSIDFMNDNFSLLAHFVLQHANSITAWRCTQLDAKLLSLRVSSKTLPHIINAAVGPTCLQSIRHTPRHPAGNCEEMLYVQAWRYHIVVAKR